MHKLTPFRMLVFAAVLSAAYLTLLLGDYFSTRQHAALEGRRNFQQEVERTANALALFLLERGNDLNGLAGAHELRSFFAARALGMSMQYGLRASLQEVESRLQSALSDTRLVGEPVYTYLAVIEPDGQVLVASVPGEAAARTPERPPVYPSTDDLYTWGWQILPSNRLIKTTAIMYKGRQAATLVAELAVGPLYRRILSNGLDAGRADFVVARDGNWVHAPDTPANLLALAARARSANDVVDPVQWNSDADLVEFVQPLPQSDFRLVSVDTPRHVYGRQDTPVLLVIAATLPVVLFGLLLVYFRQEHWRRRTAAVSALNTELEQRVAERTQALERTALEAERANRAKSVFLSKMSHELRTPMHVVLSYAGLGRKKIDSASREKLGGYFEKIDLSGQRLLALLNDLLDLSKLEAGRSQFTFETTNFVAVVAAALEELQPLLQAGALQVSHDHPPTLAVRCDKFRFGQVVRNLLSNAIKFAPHGGHIWLSSRLAGNVNADMVEFTVEDDGPGIPDGEWEGVFEAFTQSSQTGHEMGGTGLGLAISREIVEFHQGTIFATPGRSGGARFIVRLPVSGPSAAAPPAGAGDERPAARTAVR